MLPRERDAVDPGFELKYNTTAASVEDAESMFRNATNTAIPGVKFSRHVDRSFYSVWHRGGKIATGDGGLENVLRVNYCIWNGYLTTYDRN